jgi:pSer/pThr/pTyr-binding forkhead associated (FHA) protein
MSEPILTVLKFCFLALLYLFLFRVVRITVQEMRAPAPAPAPTPEAAAAPRPGPARKQRRNAPKGILQLRIVDPAARKGETYMLDREVTVGRGGGCAIVLTDDTYVSQLHARLFPHNGDSFVEDLGSTNGTFVNGKAISAATRLKRGDRVQFGQTVAEVVK